jgi:hypothetical protein
MEKTILNIPVLQKSKGLQIDTLKSSAACCAQPSNGDACCTPGQSAEEDGGDCCAQPEDGAACCNK